MKPHRTVRPIPSVVCTRTDEHTALRAKLARIYARDAHEKFWLAVQASKQPQR